MLSPLRKLTVRARLWVALQRQLSKPSHLSNESLAERRIFVGLAADYGNLGDLAITYAQKRFLEQLFPDDLVYLIPISRTLQTIAELRKTISPNDLITLVGGGNTGDMYDDIQYLRELFIRRFPQNRIISFPQTIEFSNTPYGRWAKHRACRVYNAHPDLSLLARDAQSQERATELFSHCAVVLAPDVVLTLDRSTPAIERTGVLVALRSDLERGLSDAEHEAAVSVACRLGEVRHRDTHIGDVRLTESEAQKHLGDFWADCRAAQLVITDRLHAMIFAVITGTPCVAFDSGTGKVGQFYSDWLQSQPHVTLLSVGNSADIEDACRTVMEADLPQTIGLPDIFAERFGSLGEPATSP